MIATRSPIVRLAIQAASPLALAIGVYALFAGHNQPGGGFAAGLLFGAVVVLRTVAGLQRPNHAVGFLAVGGLVVCAIAALPMFWGDALLNQWILEFDVPVLGTVKTGTALPFDVGVALIVVGLIMAVLDGLGATDLSEDARAARGALKRRTAQIEAERASNRHRATASSPDGSAEGTS